jgi:uncharacterized protein YcaQ
MAAVPRTSLTPDEARRAALAAQGFGMRPVTSGAGDGAVPDGLASDPSTRTVAQVVRRLGAVQIDSVNVLTRAHYLPVFSRLGWYDRSLLDAAGGRAPRRLFEYWGHEAALLPVATQPLLRWRMERAHREAWGGMRRVTHDHPGLVDEVCAAVLQLGPVTITELEKELAHVAPGRREHWGWNWSNVKRAVEYLFWSGEISSAGRDSTFRRRYADTARVIPRTVLRTPTPTEQEAQRELVRIAVRAQGVATRADLADHFRLSQTETGRALDDLVEAGDVMVVTVPGWPTAYAPTGLRVPRRVPGSALLAPFDPLIWFRPRTERIFGMRYRIGIYTPAHKREHGYYVLPFLHEGHLVARVDLKADRGAGRLLVQSAHAEPGCTDDAAAALGVELRRMAEWLGLADVVVVGTGELAPRLVALSPD